MTRYRRAALVLFAIGMAGLGVLALVYRDFALVWQPVPLNVPGRAALAVCSGVFMLAAAIGLIFEGTSRYASRALLPYLIVWVLLKGPAVLAAPLMEAVWLGVGELAVLLAGGWVLFATLAKLRSGSPVSFAAGRSGLHIARILFGVALIPIGLSHILYVKQTAELVPAWLPYRAGWAYLTGAGQIACGIGALVPVSAQLAAAVEAGMLSIFAMLVWAPAVVADPHSRLAWTAFFITWVIAAGAWLVAANPEPRGATR
jgi:uncharacterized membrane protein